MSYTIITHSGKAHIDEVMGIALIAARGNELPANILRIPPDEAAEAVGSGRIQEGAWVVDCGMIFDPTRYLFDHHQDPELPCAALLLFRHLFPELEDTALGDYFKILSKVDTCGTGSLEDADRVGESRTYWSMPQQMLVKAFESSPLAVTEVMSSGLQEKIAFEETKRTAGDWAAVADRIRCTEVGGHAVLEYREPPPPDIVDGLKAIDGDLIESRGAAAIYGFDKNDPTIRTLYRTDIGRECLDFTRANFSEPLFCHQNGFLVKFRPADDAEWKRRIIESQRRP